MNAEAFGGAYQVVLGPVNQSDQVKARVLDHAQDPLRVCPALRRLYAMLVCACTELHRMVGWRLRVLAGGAGLQPGGGIRVGLGARGWEAVGGGLARQWERLRLPDGLFGADHSDRRGTIRRTGVRKFGAIGGRLGHDCSMRNRGVLVLHVAYGACRVAGRAGGGAVGLVPDAGPGHHRQRIRHRNGFGGDRAVLTAVGLAIRGLRPVSDVRLV